MSWYNHFSDYKFKRIAFSSLGIGEKFRQDFFSNGRRRVDIICIKTGELSYVEQRNKTEHLLKDASKYEVSALIKQP